MPAVASRRAAVASFRSSVRRSAAVFSAVALVGVGIGSMETFLPFGGPPEVGLGCDAVRPSVGGRFMVSAGASRRSLLFG